MDAISYSVNQQTSLTTILEWNQELDYCGDIDYSISSTTPCTICTFDSTTNTLSIYTTNTADVSQFSIDIQGTQGTITESMTLSIEVLDPCIGTSITTTAVGKQ